MGTLKLRYPVHTLDNQELLPAGTLLTAETLHRLISAKASTTPLPRASLLEYGTVKGDLLSFLDHRSYRVIFAEEERAGRLLELMERVHLILPVLKSLDYFRQRDFYTYRHILNVFALSSLLAQDLVEDRQELMQEATAGPTHDFGKICVPLPILRKTDPLTRTERQLLEHHTAAGYVLLSYFLQDPESLAATVARDHHERRDGSGYPLGIRLQDFMVEIVTASDIYDALISPRPYRRTSYDNRTALEEITGMAQRGELSWEVVQALVAKNRKGKPQYKECRMSEEMRGTPPADNVYGVVAPDTDGPKT